MKNLLQKFGDFLGTPLGFWITMLLTALTGVLALWAMDAATYVLSVIAIILPGIILVHDQQRDKIASQRDKALHRKIDELLRATDKANDKLAECEPDDGD